jgi:multiple sugar transport system ATP-binding protein
MNFIEGEVDTMHRFTSGALALNLGGAAPELPRPVTLGVRPECISIGADGALSGTIALVEPMGNHQVAWIDCGGQQLSAIVTGTQQFALGQQVRFGIDTARVSLFDPQSGNRL